MKPPELSVCVVARNGGKTTERLFDSLDTFAARHGDMVLVDTGSTDDTAERYGKFGFRVFKEGGRFQVKIPCDISDPINARAKEIGDAEIISPGASLFDFAEARNYAASLAFNDCVLNPDADEALTVFDISGVEEQFKSASRLRFDYVFSHKPDGSPYRQFITDTRATNRKHWRWSGLVHETSQPITPGASMAYVPPSILKIEHWQIPSPTRSNYLSGLAYACAIDPDNDRNYHYYGRELFYRGHYRSAIKELERHISLSAWDKEKCQSMLYIGDCHAALRNEAQAIESYNSAILLCDTSREPYMRMAMHWYRKGDHRRAAAYAAAALEIQDNGYFGNTPENYLGLPHEILYWAKWWLGDKLGSRQHWLKAIELEPNSTKYKSDSQFYK